MANQRLILLFNRYRSKTCTAAEKQELAMLCLLPENKTDVEELLSDTWNNTAIDQLMPAEKGEHILQLILQDAAAQPSAVLSLPTKDQQSFNWRRIAVAASIILFISFGVYVISTRNEEKSPAVVDVPTNNDVQAPDKNRAQIKLSDGSIVYLDSAANGELVNVNGVQVTKTEDGRVVYSPLTTHDSPLTISYNTLSNPRGSKVIDITLADGSHVWLNAGSTITYPVAFIGKERNVSITGEAYFEIAKHDFPAALAAGKKGVRMPFIVEANGTSTEVLGTHFNINAYDDESDIKVTLLEGSVSVISKRSEKSPAAVRLTPGQQAVATHDSRITTHDANLEEALAWKNQQFIFDRLDVASIMRQLSRWYNVDVIYQGKVPADQFSGVISRQRNISAVLDMLKATGDIQFTIDGKKITVNVPK